MSNAPEHEHEREQDDLDVEIVEIPGPEKGAGERKIPSFLTRLQPHRLSRQRKLQLAATTGFVLLALLIIVASTSPVRERVLRALIPPTPTPLPTLAPGEDLFYVQGEPPWGHLFIDGHPVAHVPVTSIGLPLRLSLGRHILQWRAAPFITQACTLSVPPDFASDTCSDNQVVPKEGALYGLAISFPASLNSVLPGQRASLIDAVQAALDDQQSSTMVHPGEQYVSPAPCQHPQAAPFEFSPCYAVAQQLLKATLSFRLDTNMSSNQDCASPEPQPVCSFNYQSCHLLCTFGYSASAWFVGAAVQDLWTFTTLDGHVIAQDVLDNQIEESLVRMQITWDGTHWHVLAEMGQSFFNGPICQPIEMNTNLLGEVTVQWQFISAPVLADGCVAVATAGQLGTSTPTPSSTAYCLYRFGALVAANDIAHRLWPYMPVATGYEQSLVQHIVGSAS